MKVLVESFKLVFSHLTYVIFVWGLSLKQHLVERLKHLQSHSVCLLFVRTVCIGLSIYIIDYYCHEEQLPFSELIKYSYALCSINIIVWKGIPLKPLIGQLTEHYTVARIYRIKNLFSHPERCLRLM